MTTSIPEDQVPHKLCKKCGNEYPATREYFAFQNNAPCAPCRQCRRESGRKYDAERHKTEEWKQRHREYQRKCDERHRDQRVEWHHRYYEANREEIRQKSQCYYAGHKEHRRAYALLHKERRQIWYEQYKVRRQDAQRQYKQKYQQEHREQLSVYHRNYALTHQEEKRHYQQLHREENRIRSHKRRARKHPSTEHHTVQQIREQYARQRGRCYYCTKKVKWGDHHIEHVVPLSRGGSNEISNIVVSCAPCNWSKGSKLPHEWGKRLL